MANGRSSLWLARQNMYPETIANDNPDLAGSLSPCHRSRLGSVQAARLTSADRWRALPGYLGRAALYLMLPVVLFNCDAEASGKLRLAVQKTGTFAWELAIISERGLDRKAGLAIEVTELASPEAAKIALMGGAADMILGDWLWVARQRNLGRRLVFAPYSTALGAVMVPAASPIEDLAGLKGKKIAVAGGPLDKSWLLLQALARKVGSGHRVAGEHYLWRAGSALSEGREWRGRCHLKLLEFLRGPRIERVPAAHRHRRGGTAPWRQGTGRHGRLCLRRGLRANTCRRALAVFQDRGRGQGHPRPFRRGLGEDRARNRDRRGSRARALYRQTYIDGIPRRPVAEEAADARALYRVLARIGGQDLTGPAKELDEETYYKDGIELAPRQQN